MLKHAAVSELIDAVRTVLSGRYYVSSQIAKRIGAEQPDLSNNPGHLFGGELTPRQREVLQLIAEGKSMKEMAELLHVSVRTIEFHKSCIVQLLGLRTTADLTRYAISHGMTAV